MLLNATKSFFLLRIILLFLILTPFIAFSQSAKPGSIEYLKMCNGYNGIKLGADVNLIAKSKLFYLDNDSRLDADSCYKFEYRDTSLLKVGNDFYLDLVGIRTHKNKVVNIYLFFKKSDGYKLLNTFLAAYGVFTSKPDDYSDIYNWHSSMIDVSLRYQSDNDLGLGIAIYTFNQQDDELQAMQSKH